MKSLIEYLERSADVFPNKTALRYEDEIVTYADLRQRSKKIASGIIPLKDDGELRSVAVFLPRGTLPIICYMGILYAGLAYVPMNYALPDNRIENTFNTLQPLCVITDDENKERISKLCKCPVFTAETLSETEINSEIISETQRNVCDCDPAYVMFTSGSTGEPKGVTVSQRGVIDYVDSMLCEFKIDENTVIGMQSPLYFDISVFDIYVGFCCGAEIVIIPEKIFMFPNMVPQYVNDFNINLIYWVPTVFDGLVANGVLYDCPFKKVDTIIFAGEAMRNSTLNVLRKTHSNCSFTNLYGPTETSVISMIYKVEKEFKDEEPLPIGRACKNSSAFIIDESGNEITADGIRGEIVLGGIGVGLGYWGNFEISDRAFIQNPLNSSYFDRVYKTGDIGYYKDGIMMFAGRSDSQIKHRGNRIELSDIECAACAVENVSGACAVYDSEKSEIVLFIESRDQWNLRKFNLELKKHIPSYMLPAKIHILDSLPHTPNGKTDRVTLKKLLTEEK